MMNEFINHSRKQYITTLISNLSKLVFYSQSFLAFLAALASLAFVLCAQATDDQIKTPPKIAKFLKKFT